MTASQELQTFAQALEPFCRENNAKFVCLMAEHDLLRVTRLSNRPYLYLSQVAEELTCGHILPIAVDRNFFVRVRAPMVASSTLKVIKLRTFSLILAENRGMAMTCYERVLAPGTKHRDLWDLLNEATEAVIGNAIGDLDFIQPEPSAPVKTENAELVAFRAVFCTGTIVGTVLSSDASGLQAADAGASPMSVTLYTL